MAVANFRDAKRVLAVLDKRLARYELTLHPEKTRFVDFRSYRSEEKDPRTRMGPRSPFSAFATYGKVAEGQETSCGK